MSYQNESNQPPPQPQRRKHRKWPWVLGGIVVIGIIIGVSTSGGGSSNPNGSVKDAGNEKTTTTEQKPQVTYKITTDDGSAADVTWMNGGSQSQDNGAKTPWSKSIPSEGFDMYSLTAQNKGSGTITCSINKDGKMLKESQSSGQFAVVSCSASD